MKWNKLKPTHWFLDQINARLQIHPKINELPLNPLLSVLLLLQDKHGVVEKLLQFLIGEVDAQLLQGVELWEEISLANSLATVTKNNQSNT